ncbi:MAG: response regulator [Actinomycetota bacterium]
MSAERKPRVLLVDDEPRVLEGLVDILRRGFDVVTAVGGPDGAARLDDAGPFAVVVSDLRMPKLGGAALLAIARQKAPETTRILLTGNADVETAIEAVNAGHIFRFLTKPCPKDTLLRALVAGVAQHRLVVGERVLVEETLRGALEALSNTLALANPAAFGRATRLRERASLLAQATDVANPWEVEIAAMLSQIGCLALPAETAERYYFGRPLAEGEQALVDAIPGASADVLADVPRLEGVCRILRAQQDGASQSEESDILRIVHDADVLESQGMAADLIVGVLRKRGSYDPALLDLYAFVSADDERVLAEMELGEVRPGMSFVHDVTSRSGVLLVARGSTVSKPLLDRIALLPERTRALTVTVAR